MSVTLNVVDHPDVRVKEEDVEVVPPDAVEFTVEGTVTVTRDLLGAFEGQCLRPVAVAVAAEESHVTVDLRDEASLRLDVVDVGVETPDVDDVVPTSEGVDPSTAVGPEPADLDAGAIAFTVEGTIAGIGRQTVDALADGAIRVEAVTFAVDEARVTDGGSGDDVVFDVSLLGFHVAIRRDGTITVVRE